MRAKVRGRVRGRLVIRVVIRCRVRICLWLEVEGSVSGFGLG